MKKGQDQIKLVYELDEEDMAHIREIFHEDMVPKLIKYDARLGNLSCEFAGEQYKNWILQFQSAGSGFEIVEFEYDEEGDVLDLDL